MDGPSDVDWAPPRPPSYAGAWSETSGGGGGSRRVAAVDAVEDVRGPGTDSGRQGGGATRIPRPRGLFARSWRRSSLGRRILVSYLALATAIALVVTVGAAFQPVYGSLKPWHGIAIDDLRSSPTTSAWAIDLAATLAPGAPAECLRFTATDVGRDLAVVRADGAWTDGFSENPVCSVVPLGFRSRIALLDTADGTVRWVHDLGADFTSGQDAYVSWTSIVAGATRVLVRASTLRESVIETLSVLTGKVIQSTGPSQRAQEDRFTASGDVVATGAPSADGLTYVYELRSAEDLNHVVWRGEGNQDSTMIALSDRLLLGDDATTQIPLSTGVASRWGAPVNTSFGYAVHDDVVYATHTRGHGVTTVAEPGFSAVDKTGRLLWQSTATLRGSYSVTRSCLAVTNRPGDRLSCLDFGTGAVRWTDQVGAFSAAGSAAGQRSNDVYAVSTGDTSRLIAVDADTGRERFRADVPAGSSLIAAGRTVGYLLAYGFSGSHSNLIAVDLSSGHRLWSYQGQLQLALWGGHLIDIGSDGLARRLDR